MARPLCRVPLLLLTAALAAPAHATFLAEAEVRELVGSSPNTLCGQGGPGERSAGAICNGPKFSGEARARADEGDVGTYARLSDLGEEFPQPLDYQAFGRARFTDTIRFNSSLLQAGQLTDARMVLDFRGSETRIPPPFSQGGTLAIFTTLEVRIDGQLLNSSNGNTIGILWFDFDYDPAGATRGTVDISIELISDVRCFNCADYEGISDFESSAAVTDFQLLDLAPQDYTVSSEEGATYANVVPEPSVGLLLGLAALVRLRRWR